MFYDRQVRYLDDMVNGERKGNGGFVKIEVRGSVCNVNLCIKGLGQEDTREVSVYLVTAEKTVHFCILELKSGCGTKQLLNLNTEDIANTGISYHDLKAVKISLSTERELCAYLEKKGGQVGHQGKVMEKVELWAASESTEVVAIQDEMTQELIEEDVVEEPGTDELQEGAVTEILSEKKSMPLKETKWKQLWEIYPQISPFQDGRKYLSVSPGDFVLLPEKYFGMVNNSFLLHGYYNYHHLVLKRLESYGQVKYYIGVPGNFYDREKQVAVMFGFESFEGMQEPARVGDFGYYLMGVEL